MEKIEKIDISVNPIISELDKAARLGTSRLKEYLKSDEYDAVYYRYLCCHNKAKYIERERKKILDGEEDKDDKKKKKKK
jgi:hypothetical protein